MNPARAADGRHGGDAVAGAALALAAMSVRRLPAEAAERYLEEFLADLMELERRGRWAMLKHAFGIAATSRRLGLAVAGPPSRAGRTWALRALAHLGISVGHIGPTLYDGAYVFKGPLRSGRRGDDESFGGFPAAG